MSAYAFVPSAVDLGRARGPRRAFIVHMAEGGNTVGYLSRPNPNGVSVHFVVKRTGSVVRMLDLDRMHSSIKSSAIRTTDDADGFYGVTAARAVMGEWADVRRSLGPNHASIAVEGRKKVPQGAVDLHGDGFFRQRPGDGVGDVRARHSAVEPAHRTVRESNGDHAIA